MSVIATHAFAFVPSCIILELRYPEFGYSLYSYARARQMEERRMAVNWIGDGYIS